QQAEQTDILKQQIKDLHIAKLQNVDTSYLAKKKSIEYVEQCQKLYAQKEQLDGVFSASKDELEKVEHSVKQLKENKDNATGTRKDLISTKKYKRVVQGLIGLFLVDIGLLLFGWMKDQLATMSASILLLFTLGVLYLSIRRMK